MRGEGKVIQGQLYLLEAQFNEERRVEEAACVPDALLSAESPIRESTEKGLMQI